jgi:hypothetical protein
MVGIHMVFEQRFLFNFYTRTLLTTYKKKKEEKMETPHQISTMLLLPPPPSAEGPASMELEADSFFFNDSHKTVPKVLLDRAEKKNYKIYNPLEGRNQKKRKKKL